MLLSLTIFSLLFSLLRTTKEVSSVTAWCNDVDVDVDFYVECLLVISEWLVPIILGEVMTCYFQLKTQLLRSYEGFRKLPNLSFRPLVQSVYQKNNFLTSQPKHML